MAAHSRVRAVAHALRRRAEESLSSESLPTQSTSTGPVSQTSSSTPTGRPLFNEPSPAVKALVGVIVVLAVILIGLGAWKVFIWKRRKRFASARAMGIDEALGRPTYDAEPRQVVLNPGPAPSAESGARWVPQVKPWMTAALQPPAPAKTRESISEKMQVADPFAATPRSSQESVRYDEKTIVGDGKSEEEAKSQTATSPPPVSRSPPPLYRSNTTSSNGSNGKFTPTLPPTPPTISLPTPTPPTPPASFKLKTTWEAETPQTPTRMDFPSPVRSASFAHQQSMSLAAAAPPSSSPLSAPPPTNMASGGHLPRAMIVSQTFAANLSDELVVRHAEPLTMLEEYADGWCLCQRANGERGVVPRFCVTERPAPSPAPATPRHKRKSSRFRSLNPSRRS